ncbi:MAG: ABC transporter substrate-binding protein [Tepidisphaera sp.]|nr:ABC transporter substrate-binding protein [Tepidisphaera sp.]
MTKPTLLLAHSGDPDDAFMWWPITGKVMPDGTPWPGADAEPRITTRARRYRAVPGDIAVFNRIAKAGARYDLTALSVRAYADVQEKYVITRMGASFGEGYGPRVIAPADDARQPEDILRDPGAMIAIPGFETSAFLALGLYLGEERLRDRARFVELPFDQIIPFVCSGRAAAGLVIHEGQITFGEANLRSLLDLGEWWQATRGLPLPLGVNAVKRDLDATIGPGTLASVARDLHDSLAYALEHRDESVAYCMPYAAHNAGTQHMSRPSEATVRQYLDMYVTGLTRDLGETGLEAIRRLLEEGAAQGLCPAPRRLDVLG